MFYPAPLTLIKENHIPYDRHHEVSLIPDPSLNTSYVVVNCKHEDMRKLQIILSKIKYPKLKISAFSTGHLVSNPCHLLNNKRVN